MRNAARIAVLGAFTLLAACGGGDGSGPSDPVPASVAVNNGNNQSAQVATALALAPSVIVKDQRGNPIPGTSVTFAVQTGGGTVTGAQVVTDASGIAQVGAWTLGTTSGPQTMRATVVGLTPVTFTATATPGPAASLVFTTPPPLGAINRVAFTTQPVLQLKDLFGNNATQPGVLVTASIETGGGTLGGTVTVASNASGGVAFTNLSIGGVYGTRTLRFSATGMTPLLSGPVELLAGAPTSLTPVSPTVFAGVVGSDIATNLNVFVADIDGNQVQGETVTFTVTAGGGSLGATSAITDADGQAYVSPWTLGTVAGQLNTVSATLGALTPVVFSATPVAGPASRLSLTTQPGTTSAVNGSLVAPQPSLQVTDQYGNGVGGVVSVTAAIGSGGGTLGGTVAANTAADGALSFTDLAITGSAGARTLGFASPGLTGVTSASFTLTPGAATTIAASAGNGQSATVGTAVTTAPAVLVTDQSGNPVSGTGVTFAVTGGGGSATGTSATTNASGIATIGSWTLGGIVGNNTLTASAAGLAGSPVGFTATGTAAAASQLALVTPPSATSTNGVALAQQPSVRLRDPFGNAVSQAGVVVTAQVSTGGGSVSGGTTAITDAAGLATFSGLIVNGPIGQSQTLQFTAPALTAVSSGGITLGPGAPARLLVTTQPSATVANGVALATQPAVQVTDAGGNAVVLSVNVVASIASGGGSLGGTTTIATDGTGKAAFTNLSITGLAGPHTLGFAATGLTGTASGTITVTAGAATTIAVNAGNNQSATVNSAVPTAPSVLVTDQSGNPVAGVNVTFAVTGGGGGATGLAQVTGANGLATVGSWTLGQVAGANSLSATATGLAGSPVSFTATGTAAAASTLVFTATPSATATYGTALAQQPVVALRDPFGNAVPQAGVSVTAAIASGNGTLAGTTTAQTNAGGTATFSGLAINGLVGNYTIGFGAPGLTSLTSGTIALSAGAASILTVNAGQGQSATVGTAVAIAPSVLVTDGGGNPVGGVAVTFSVTSGGGAVLGGGAVTDGSGHATVTSWTLGTASGSNTLTATSAGLAGSPTIFTATATAGAPVTITAQTATNQAGRVGIAATVVPSVLVKDQYDNPVPNASVTFEVTNGGGIVSGGNATTSASGIATIASWTFGRTVVPNTVTATLAALPPVAFNATVTFEVATLAAGGVHTCATTVDDIPYCWGLNTAGSLGDGTSTQRLTPVPVSGHPVFGALGLGADFSCALENNGTAYCWGANFRGELGKGSSGGSATPAPVAGGHSFTQLTGQRVTGANHACGITSAGTLYCWGDNTEGQLGTGAASAGANNSPLLASGGTAYTQVSAGTLFTCGLRAGGIAWCWGDNTYGQLGDNSKSDRLNPVQVSGGLSFAEVAASQVHACGRTVAGAVYCWGLNTGGGRLGQDTTVVTESLVPMQVPGLTGIVELSLGEGHSCARAGNGAVYCWGLNDSGQLGNGVSGVNSFTPVAVVLPGGVSGFTSISAGGSFTCGATSGGAAYCWGEGDGGELGRGSTADTPLPALVSNP